MILTPNISDSLGDYMNYIKSENHFVLSLPPRSTELWRLIRREMGCVTVLTNLSLYIHLEHCREIPSHMTLGSRLGIQQKPNQSLSTLPKWIYKWGMREWDEWHGMVVHYCREATKNICGDLSIRPQKYTHTFHHLNILSLGGSQRFFYLFPRMSSRF